jgi:hypothetical protein
MVTGLEVKRSEICRWLFPFGGADAEMGREEEEGGLLCPGPRPRGS